MNVAPDVEVNFEGHEGTMTLTFRPAPSTPVGVACGLVRITVGRLDAEVRTLVDADARRLRDELRALMATPTISGMVGFGSVENDLHVSIDLNHGKGTITAKVETDFGDQDGSAQFRLTTDQAALQNTVRQLDALLRTFPKL